MGIVNLEGKRFGNLTAQYATDDRMHSQVVWCCLCGCGNEVMVASNNLQKGNTSSCGCSRKIGGSGTRLEDLTDERFCRLVVLERDFSRKTRVAWKCQCDCGGIITAFANNLKRGLTQSCGCLNKEVSPTKHRTHGLRNHPLYAVWVGMRQRCYDPNAKQFKDWGGRGIRVCTEWNDSFKAFYTWAMKHGYEQGLTLDREDNDGNYTPNNCRFVTRKVQANNRRIRSRA